MRSLGLNVELINTKTIRLRRSTRGRGRALDTRVTSVGVSYSLAILSGERVDAAGAKEKG